MRLCHLFLFFSLFFVTGLVAAEKTRIAVVNFVAQPGVDPNMAATITDLLTGALVNLKKFDVVDRANMDRVMREQALQQSGCTEQACAVKLGNILNVQKLVVGKVSKLGSKIYLSVSFVDVERSRTELAENEVANNEDEILPKVQALAAKIDGKVNISGRILTAKESGTYLINIGRDDGLKVGQVVSVSRPGEAIIDQTTGELLGKAMIDLGEARVVTVDPGGTLATVKASKEAKSFIDGDRVSIAISVKDAGSRPVADSPKKASGLKPVFLISGLALGVGGGGGALACYLISEQKYNAYLATDLTAAKANGSTFDTQWADYQNTLNLVTPMAVVGGVGAALFVTSLFLKGPEKKTALVPTFDGQRLGLTLVHTF